VKSANDFDSFEQAQLLLRQTKWLNRLEADYINIYS
jgi:hypothetical protein